MVLTFDNEKSYEHEFKNEICMEEGWFDFWVFIINYAMISRCFLCSSWGIHIYFLYIFQLKINKSNVGNFVFIVMPLAANYGIWVGFIEVSIVLDARGWVLSYMILVVLIKFGQSLLISRFVGFSYV
jgi:uncharacterized membrane protein